MGIELSGSNRSPRIRFTPSFPSGWFTKVKRLFTHAFAGSEAQKSPGTEGVELSGRNCVPVSSEPTSNNLVVETAKEVSKPGSAPKQRDWETRSVVDIHPSSSVAQIAGEVSENTAPSLRRIPTVREGLDVQMKPI